MDHPGSVLGKSRAHRGRGLSIKSRLCPRQCCWSLHTLPPPGLHAEAPTSVSGFTSPSGRPLVSLISGYQGRASMSCGGKASRETWGRAVVWATLTGAQRRRFTFLAETAQTIALLSPGPGDGSRSAANSSAPAAAEASGNGMAGGEDPQDRGREGHPSHRPLFSGVPGSHALYPGQAAGTSLVESACLAAGCEFPSWSGRSTCPELAGPDAPATGNRRAGGTATEGYCA